MDVDMMETVAGEMLDMALARAKKGARFVQCGGISQYNATTPYGIKVSEVPSEFSKTGLAYRASDLEANSITP